MHKKPGFPTTAFIEFAVSGLLVRCTLMNIEVSYDLLAEKSPLQLCIRLSTIKYNK